MKISESMEEKVEAPKKLTHGMRCMSLRATPQNHFLTNQLAGIAQEAKHQMDKDYVNRSPSQYTGIRKTDSSHRAGHR